MMGFVGDVLVCRKVPREVFGDVRDVLEAPHILFANLECAYTDEPRPVPSAPALVRSSAHNLDVFAEVGFDVLSLANNHILDAGYEAMLDTRSRLRAQGIKTCGVGESLADARKPAIVEAEGLKVAFLAYATTFPMGYEARSDRAGLVPMRAYNLFRDPLPNYHVPGMRPLVSTVPDDLDLANLADDIRRARDHADLVITSFHWGDYTCPFHLTDHEKRTARYCIDQGAHMVVGHHHHVLRGMEWYKGRPIMYGLGHFVWDSPVQRTEEEHKRLRLERDPTGYFEQAQYLIAPRQGWPFLPMHEDTRMTLVAWATASREGIADIGFLPCRLTPDGLVRPLNLHSSDSNEVVRYFEKCNTTQGLESALSEDSISLAGFQTLRVVPG